MAASAAAAVANDTTLIPDFEIIKPYKNKDVLRITSYGAVSDKSLPSPALSASINSTYNNFDVHDGFGAFQKCIDSASVIFKKIDEVVEENKIIGEKKKIKNPAVLDWKIKKSNDANLLR